MTNRQPRDGNAFITLPHKRFLDLTRTRYNDLKHRVRKFFRTASMELPYTLNQYRDWVREQLGGEGGATRCFYCDAFVNIETMQTEHYVPLAQNGCLQFTNLRVSCEFCNQQKGILRPLAFAALLRLANDRAIFTQVDRDNLFGRLQIAMKLTYKVRMHERLARLGKAR